MLPKSRKLNDNGFVKSSKTLIGNKNAAGETTILKSGIALQESEVIDATFMSKKALCEYFEKETRTFLMSFLI